MSNGQQYCIVVDNLVKYYDNSKIRALDGLSFHVEYGKVFGFLGPNGAGKTTTIKILTTLVPPSSGKVQVLGQDLTKDSQGLRSRIGVVLQKPSYEGRLTVEKSLNLYGMLWGVEESLRKRRINELIEVFDLVDVKNTKNEELSIGQRRRVQVAREFVHDMDLLFLDEPTVGLDPSARRSLLDYIKKQVKEGLTVFFTTHILEEAEYLCDEIAIINKGRTVAIDTPLALKSKYGAINTVEISLKDNSAEAVGRLVQQSLASPPNLEIVDPRTIRIHSANTEDLMLGLFDVLVKNRSKLESIRLNSPSLEEAFLSILNVDDVSFGKNRGK